MQNPETFQLRIATSNPGIKDDLKNWLIGNGEESFVEGALDDLFEDPSYEVGADEQFDNLGGDLQPLFVYKYDREHILQLESELLKSFGSEIVTELSALSTQDWMEGWKESFKPIQTDAFYIYPPWLADKLPTDRIPIVIEPGMAFGTGQHATTVLCLEALENMADKASGKEDLLDVGTGTGILAIAGAKLGYKRILATDIDSDAIIASRENAAQNNVSLDLLQCSVPQMGGADLVLANIIFFVLKQIIGDLASQVRPDGILILSGLLVEEMQDMASLAKAHDLVLLQDMTRDDWACQIYRKIPT